MLSSHQATISDARRLRKSGSYNSEQSGSGNIKQTNAIKISLQDKIAFKALLGFYVYKSQMLSSHQATISYAEDLRNLDHTIVNNQGLEISRKHRSKCIENCRRRTD